MTMKSKFVLRLALVILLPVAVVIAAMQYSSMSESARSAVYCLAPSAMNVLLILGLLRMLQQQDQQRQKTSSGSDGSQEFWTEEQFAAVELPSSAGGRGLAEIHVKRVFKSEEITIRRKFVVDAAPTLTSASAAGAATTGGAGDLSSFPALEYKPDLTSLNQEASLASMSAAATATRREATQMALLPTDETAASLAPVTVAPPPPPPPVPMVQLPVKDVSWPAEMVQLPVAVIPEERPAMVQLPIGREPTLPLRDDLPTMQQIPVTLTDVPVTRTSGPVISVPIQEAEDPFLQQPSATSICVPTGGTIVGPAPPPPSQPIPVVEYAPVVVPSPAHKASMTTSTTLENSSHRNATTVFLSQAGGQDTTSALGNASMYQGRFGGSPLVTHGESVATRINEDGITVGTRLVYISITKEAHIRAGLVQAYLEGRLGDPTAITAGDIPSGLNLPGLEEQLANLQQQQASGQTNASSMFIEHIGPRPATSAQLAY